MPIKLICAISCLAIITLSACQTSTPALTTKPSTLFAAPWNSGIDKLEPEFHIQNIDENTLVFRQSLRTTFEAPFLYLIFGDEKALLIDTGVEGVNLRDVVDQEINKWLSKNGRDNVALTVMHSHGHGDHVGGDSSFTDRPNTYIVGHAPEDVTAFFDIIDWPSGSVAYDLGNRTVDILPTPGHHPSHAMVFDETTNILFTGDTIYPGKLYFQCGKLNEYSATIDKVASFTESNDVQWLLGGHVEMTTASGETFQANKKSRSGEHLLELPVSIINDIQIGLKDLSSELIITEYDEFVLFPHPADPRGKQPPNWCLTDK